MKKLITALFLTVFLWTGLQAEDLRLDSILYYDWNSSTSEWSIDDVLYYSYNEGVVDSIFDVSETSRKIEVYDVRGNVLEEITQQLDTTGWVDVEKTIKTYDSNDNMTSYYDEIWTDTTGWMIEEGETKTTLEFDDNSQQIAKKVETYTSGEWVATTLYTYTLNDAGLVTGWQAKKWSDTIWVNAAWCEFYEYNEAGQMTSMIWNKPSSDAIGDYNTKYAKWDYTYDEAGQLIDEVYYRKTFSDGTYKTYRHYTYGYDESGNRTLYVYDRNNSDNTGYVPYRKYIYSYDKDGNKTSELYLKANDDKDGYYTYSYDTYAYDEDGNEISERVNKYNEGDWENNKNWDYTLDTLGRVTEVQCALWDDTIWTNTSANAMYEYDNDGNVVEEIWNKSTDTSEFGEYEALYLKYERTYDANNNMLSNERFKVNSAGDGYDIYRYYGYEYDTANNNTYYVEKRSSGGAYYGYKEYVMSYDANSNLTEKIYNKNNSDKTGFKTYAKYTYEYNGAGQETLELYAEANSEDSLQYDNSTRTMTTYSTEGNKTVVRDEKWDGSAWVLDEETQYAITLNGDNNIVKSIKIKTEDDTSYDTINITTFTYEEGVLTQSCVFDDDDSTVYVYDVTGNCILETSYELVDGAWTMDKKTVSEYDELSNKTMTYEKVWDDTYAWTVKAGTTKYDYEYDTASVMIDKEYTKWVAESSYLYSVDSLIMGSGVEGEVSWKSFISASSEDGITLENESKVVAYYSDASAGFDDVDVSDFGGLYPNPTSDVVYLPKGDYSFAIYSIDGHKVMSGVRSNTEKISVSGMVSGVYIFRYIGSDVNKAERFVVR